MSFASNLLRAINLAVRTIESITEDPWHSKYRLHLMVFGGECRPYLLTSYMDPLGDKTSETVQGSPHHPSSITAVEVPLDITWSLYSIYSL